MKIPPKILKHSVKNSNEAAPREIPPFTDNPSDNDILADDETPATPALLDAQQPDDQETLHPMHQDEPQKPVLKPQVIENIPKPAPVGIKKPEPIYSLDQSDEIDIEDVDVSDSADMSGEPKPARADSDSKEPHEPAPKFERKARAPKAANRNISPEGKALAKRIQRETDLQKMPESLPVLEAFQDFLDSEQRKMRKRIVTLSVIFTIITISLIAGGITAAWHIINPLKTEVDSFRSSISSLEDVAKSNRNNNVEIVSQLNKMIEHEREINRDTASEIATQVNSYGDNLIEIKDLISKLQTENAALKAQLGNINRDLPDVTYKVATILNEIDKMRTPAEINTSQVENTIPQPEDINPPARKDEPSVIADGASAKTFSAIITFVPRGFETRVACQLPIPE